MRVAFVVILLVGALTHAFATLLAAPGARTVVVAIGEPAAPPAPPTARDVLDAAPKTSPPAMAR